MLYENFFKQSFLRQNLKINTILQNYDGNGVGEKDGKFSKEEVSVFIKESVIPLGTFIFGKKTLTNYMFKLMDTNNDDYITQKEIDEYLQRDFKLKLDELRDKDVVTACRMLDAAG